MADVQGRLDAIAAKLAELRVSIDRVRKSFSQTAVAADLQAIGEDIDKLVTDVKSALAEYRDPQPAATE